MNNQSFKQDAGKPRLSLVPIGAIDRAVARIREFGITKYPDVDGWHQVEPERILDALFRHMDEVRDYGIWVKDDESGLPSIWHAACNMVFLLTMIEDELKDEEIIERMKS